MSELLKKTTLFVSVSLILGGSLIFSTPVHAEITDSNSSPQGNLYVDEDLTGHPLVVTATWEETDIQHLDIDALYAEDDCLGDSVGFTWYTGYFPPEGGNVTAYVNFFSGDVGQTYESYHLKIYDSMEDYSEYCVDIPTVTITALPEEMASSAIFTSVEADGLTSYTMTDTGWNIINSIMGTFVFSLAMGVLLFCINFYYQKARYK